VAAGTGRWSEGRDLLGGVLGLACRLFGLAAELDATDDVVPAAAGAVVAPLAVDEAAGDRDGAALGQVLCASVGLSAEVATSMNIGWSLTSLTASRSWQTLRSSSSCLRTRSAVRFPTRVTELTAGAEALIFGFLHVGIRWLTKPGMPTRRPSGTERLGEGKGAKRP
jgi:hypothetical protein